MDTFATMKLPPHDDKAELCVLGAALIDNDVIPELSEILKPGDFYRRAYGQIYGCMVDMAIDGVKIDTVTLSDAIRSRGIQLKTDGGIDSFVIGLLTVVPTAIHALEYARIVAQHAARRRFIRAAEAVATAAFDESRPVTDVADTAANLILKNAPDTGGGVDIKQAASRLLDTVAERIATGRPAGIPTGLLDIDRALDGGLVPGMHILGARPGMGKSALAGRIALNNARAGRRVLFFNMEMTAEQLTARLAASVARVPLRKINTGQMTDADRQAFWQATGWLAELPIRFETGSMSIGDIVLRAKRRAADLVIVDYLQLITGTDMRSRAVEVGEVSGKLASLALDLNVPVLALSQLSRGVEMRANKRPILADLRDSGSIEQDATTVLFLYRDGYYNEDTDNPNVAELAVAKNRHGESGQTIRLYWHPETVNFSNLQSREVAL